MATPPAQDRSAGPLLVTGLPRSGTSWVGKMLEASGEIVYVNEPMNPAHPPGRSPGILDADVGHRFHYVCADNEAAWLPAFRHTLALRYRPVRELRRNHRPYDLARAAKYAWAFAVGRLRGRRVLLDDPYALASTPWLVDRLGCTAVVLVRDPVSLASSWRKLGWHVDPGELLAQPLLVRDYLGPYEEQLAACSGAAGERDRVGAAAALWRATTGILLDVADSRPGVIVRRYETLAGDPMSELGALYGRLGLSWSPRARARVDDATSGSIASSSRGFAWSLRGGPSRTAYRPMDSRAALATGGAALRPDEAARIRELTADVFARIGP